MDAAWARPRCRAASALAGRRGYERPEHFLEGGERRVVEDLGRHPKPAISRHRKTGHRE